MELENILAELERQARGTDIPLHLNNAEPLAERVFELLFRRAHAGAGHARTLAFELLRADITAALEQAADDADRASALARNFFDHLPTLHASLLHDAEATLLSDPAARSLTEVIFTYPGFHATAIHRIAHWFHLKHVPLLPRLWSERAHARTGIDLHPGATIGSHFSIDHGTGVVVGETAVIGAHVRVYQGVTLGALQVAKELASTKRHPTIEDHVVIYAGASILGGDTVVGRDSIVGGNARLTQSVPAGSVVYPRTEQVIRPRSYEHAQLEYMI